MTKKQREQVVKLLRCAADRLSPKSLGAWTDAVDGLAASTGVEKLASMAFFDVYTTRGPVVDLMTGRLTDVEGDREKGRHVYLEAAARVEEGSWP